MYGYGTGYSIGTLSPSSIHSFTPSAAPLTGGFPSYGYAIGPTPDPDTTTIPPPEPLDPWQEIENEQGQTSSLAADYSDYQSTIAHFDIDIEEQWSKL